MSITNVTPPAISGTAQQGQVLTTSDGTWTHTTPSTHLEFAYQWERCDAVGASCVDITAAVSQTYQLVSADVGHTIRSEVTATEVADVPPSGTFGTYDHPWGETSPWRVSAVGRAAHPNSANMISTLINNIGEVDVNRGGFTCSLWSDAYHSFATAKWGPSNQFSWFLDGVYYPTDYTDAESFGEWHAAFFDLANNRFAVSIKARLSNKSFNGMNFMRLDGSGWWDNRIDYWAPRASGAAPNGGLLTRFDMAATDIDHALSCCIPTQLGKSSSILSPATTTDQTGNLPNGIPMGACIILSSAIDVDTNPAYSGYSAVEKKMLKAIQNYGLYVTDSSSSFAIYAQNYQYGDQAGSITGYPNSPLGGNATLSRRWLQDSYIAVGYPFAFTYDSRATFGGQPHH